MKTPREQLADALRTARLEAGYPSHSAMASAMHVSRSLISKAENPRQAIPSDPVLAAWSGVTGCPLDQLTDLAQRCRSGTPEWFMSYRTAEANALILRYWSPIVVPGPAQTAGYMRALFDDEGHPLDQADEMARVRLERQQALGRVPATIIISHNVLYRLTGSPAIMAEQCAFLASLAERPNVAIHVLPEGCSMGSYGAFDIATGDATATVRMETIQDVTSTEGGLVARATVSFERLLGASASQGDSLVTIREAEEKWKAQA